MRDYEEINAKSMERQITELYNTAVKLLNLLDDNEYENVLTTYPELFGEASRSPKFLKDKVVLEKIITIFTEVLANKGMSKIEFNRSTLSELKEYMTSKINNIYAFSPEVLYKIVGELEQLAK